MQLSVKDVGFRNLVTKIKSAPWNKNLTTKSPNFIKGACSSLGFNQRINHSNEINTMVEKQINTMSWRERDRKIVLSVKIRALRK
ncbi:MAG: hypothetical protein ACJAY8_000037 [Sphingobacteriales bacterium]|jgi:hypothetical protein